MARPPLVRDERVVAWASTSDVAGQPKDRTSVVVVTTLGLWLPGRAERLGWHQIHKAVWSGSRLTVTPSIQVGSGAGYAVLADDTEIAITLGVPGAVPDEVRQRVTRSVATTVHCPMPGGGGARVVARRTPGVDGVSWHVRYDDGTDADDPAVVLATVEVLASLVGHREPGGPA